MLNRNVPRVASITALLVPLFGSYTNLLPARSFLLDGEAIVANERGLAVFDLIRLKRHNEDAVLIAFDLIELRAKT